MALIYCPECGHEISNSAVACPNCGRPIAAKTPVVERHVVAEPHDEAVPKYVIIPVLVIGGLVLLGLFMLFYRNSEDANSNLRVAVNAERTRSGTTSGTVPSSETTVGSTSSGTITMPPSTDPQMSTVPGSQVGVNAPTSGTVVIDAKIAARNGSTRPVQKERFYLLDKDLEMILNDADIEPIAGQTLMNSFGLSVVYPDRYGDFNRRALAAIKPHIKYAGTTDGSGKASLSGVEPSSYYLFGVAKSGNGFAMWSSPVSVIAGDNVMNLSPATVTEIDLSSGEE